MGLSLVVSQIHIPSFQLKLGVGGQFDREFFPIRILYPTAARRSQGLAQKRKTPDTWPGLDALFYAIELLFYNNLPREIGNDQHFLLTTIHFPPRTVFSEPPGWLIILLPSPFSLTLTSRRSTLKKSSEAPPSGKLRGNMSYFCHEVSFTTEAWLRVTQHPDDRFEAIRSPIEHLGGNIRAAFFTTGRFDVLAITEFPENITPSDISIAFAKGGAVANIHTLPLLNATQVIAAHSAPSVHSVYPRKHAVAATAGS